MTKSYDKKLNIYYIDKAKVIICLEDENGSQGLKNICVCIYMALYCTIIRVSKT